ncbi:hypothetical protein F4820DRAFT_89859 [Hypoxylon rubiginosum]|uniref:Uncharacterized protein n=1 Tax=Hypoxylon rubiginosum TaxID=110542 RepID=A0ACB9ZCC5_9PEZI|nr:hypothetical protein F4820DRAFT_89859 [Hypoxylon rubiginosum]
MMGSLLAIPFGGLLLAQAVPAASATVPRGFHIYSSQSSFLRPVAVKAQETVTYQVDRTSDGRTSATRVVRACPRPLGTNASTSPTIPFQSADAPAANVLRYGIPMPDLDGVRPDDIPEDLNRRIMASSTEGSALWQLMSPEGRAVRLAAPAGSSGRRGRPWEARTPD